MSLYRKKPVVIEAWHFDGSRASIEAVLTRTDTARFIDRASTVGPQVDIKTLEGTMTADVGDWIICGVKGEFYPCKPDIFAATYEEVKNNA